MNYSYNNDLLNNIAYFAIWFLFPFVPAFLLFKFLPNRAIVRGPFQGLNVNFGGSFAGYFILFLAITFPIVRLIKIQTENYEVWTISGKITGENSEVIDNNTHANVVFIPPKSIEDNEFSFIIVGEQQTSDFITFDKVRIEPGPLYNNCALPKLNYRRSKLNMDSLNWKIDYETRTAELKKPVILKRSN